jgi:hypothetical protein
MSQISNATLVEKAVIATDALATAGKLNPQQSDKFIDYVFDQTMLRQNARTIKFTPETLNIDKIGVGKRVAVAATEAEDPSVRRGITATKVTLTPVEVMVPFEIGDTFREINIEGQNVDEHIVRMMATVFANDLEDLFINGNKLGPAILEADYKDGGSDSQYVKDAYLGLVDGWLKLAEDAHRVDALSANVAPGLFSKMLNNMPPKFKRDRKKLRFLASIETEQLYRERLSQRATPGSDRSIENADAMTPFGVPLVGVPLLSQTPKVVEHVAVNSDGTTATALKYSNIDNVVVSASTLSSTAATPYIANTDYTVDLVNGSITRLTGQAIGSAATVKVTYTTTSRILLTHMENFVVGIGRDVRIEKQRNIFRRVNMYAITAKVAVQVEETDALVDGYNIGLTI